MGVYAQDQIKWGERWAALIGGRYAWVDNEDKLTGIKGQKDSKFSGNLGLVYLADYGFAPYASFSQSFQQEVGKKIDGSQFKPTEGEQFEAGVRWQPNGEQGNLMLSLAAYQLTKTNVAKSDPSNPSFKIQTGEVRSRGIEFEAKGQFMRNLAGSLAYAYTNAQTTQSTDLAEIGLRTDGVPEHQASMWLDYHFADLGLSGLKLGAGVRYLGTKPIAGETFKVPSSTQFDARASYDMGAWLLTLTGTNLSDELDFSECGWGTCTYTKRRTINGDVTYRF
jgi:iron complex outermembrane recepter protein